MVLVLGRRGLAKSGRGEEFCPGNTYIFATAAFFL